MSDISPLPDNIELLTWLMGPLCTSNSPTNIISAIIIHNVLYIVCSGPKYVKCAYIGDQFITKMYDTLSLFPSHHRDNEPWGPNRYFNTWAKEFPTSEYPLSKSRPRQDSLLICSNWFLTQNTDFGARSEHTGYVIISSIKRTAQTTDRIMMGWRETLLGTCDRTHSITIHCVMFLR